jgi:GH15 family glucan-1,4-alpha-glucosidase
MPNQSTFPPIRDYALIGDCRTAALVARSGAMEWLCLPDFDSPPLLGCMLDRKRGGHLWTGPEDARPHGRRYIDGTNVLETVLEGRSGRVRLIDFMPVDPRDDGPIQPQREVLRIVEALDGETEVEIDLRPAPQFGYRRSCLEDRGQIGWGLRDRGSLYLMRTDMGLKPDGDRLVGRTRLTPGERRYLSLSFVKRDPAVVPMLGAEADGKLERSLSWWREWSGQCTYDGPYRNAVLRSLLALKALQFCLSGAVVAAATTSLPEAIGAGRNWDYRFCWLRDAAFTLRAFIETGFYSEAASFFDWLMHSTRLTQPRLQSLYDVYGNTRLKERTLDDVDGYRGSRPVRVGNAASGQLQLDVYGAVVAAAAAFLEHSPTPLEGSEKRLLARFGNAVCRQWQEPDNGIWEFRNGRRHNTWSKVMCWSALDSLLRLGEDGLLSVPHERFEREREAIAQSVIANGFDGSYGSFVGAFGERYVDATLLLLPRTGFIDARDPRMVATWERIDRELSHHGVIHRYSGEVDGMAGEEGAFLICSAWAVDYLARAGRVDEAKERMERLVGFSNDVGLLSEEIEPDSGTMLGNFPQAFSHTGLVNAAFAIAAAEAGEEPK